MLPRPPLRLRPAHFSRVESAMLVLVGMLFGLLVSNFRTLPLQVAIMDASGRGPAGAQPVPPDCGFVAHASENIEEEQAAGIRTNFPLMPEERHRKPNSVIIEDDVMLKRYSSPTMMHLINNSTRFEGALLIPRALTSLFKFTARSDLWDLLPPNCHVKPLYKDYRSFRLRGGCRWCILPSRKCILNGTFTSSGDIIDDSHRPYGKTNDFLLARSYVSNNMSYQTWETIWAACDFDRIEAHNAREALATFDGYIEAPSLPGLRLSTRAGLTLKSTGENIVCSRAFMGDLDPEAAYRFVDHYASMWKMDRVVLYGIGLDMASVSMEWQHYLAMKRKELVFVDLRNEFQSLYGTLAQDAALVSYANAQMLLKIDCTARAKSLGAMWVLHVDKDELLFPSANHSFESWEALVQSYPDANWLSFPQLNPKENIPCSMCPWNQSAFAEQAMFTHLQEVSDFQKTYTNISDRHTKMLFSSYFIRVNGHSGKWDGSMHYGRRKVAVRLDRRPPAVWGTGQHKMHPCAYRTAHSKDRTSQNGIELDGLSSAYIRHYGCLNLALFNCTGWYGQSRAGN